MSLLPAAQDPSQPRTAEGVSVPRRTCIQSEDHAPRAKSFSRVSAVSSRDLELTEQRSRNWTKRQLQTGRAGDRAIWPATGSLLPVCRTIWRFVTQKRRLKCTIERVEVYGLPFVW